MLRTSGQTAVRNLGSRSNKEAISRSIWRPTFATRRGWAWQTCGGGWGRKLNGGDPVMSRHGRFSTELEDYTIKIALVASYLGMTT